MNSVIWFVTSLLVFSCFESTGQSVVHTATGFLETTFVQGLTAEVPPGFLRIKRRILRRHKPRLRIKNSMGYAHSDGSKLLLYHTGMKWNFSEVGLWDSLLGISARMFPQSIFLESGYHVDSEKRGSDIYFIKIHDSGGDNDQCVLVTFSKLKGTVLFGVYTSTADNYDTWEKTSNHLLANHFLRLENSVY